MNILIKEVKKSMNSNIIEWWKRIYVVDLDQSDEDPQERQNFGTKAQLLLCQQKGELLC